MLYTFATGEESEDLFMTDEGRNETLIDVYTQEAANVCPLKSEDTPHTREDYARTSDSCALGTVIHNYKRS